MWIWLALDVNTGEIVGVYVGKRSREGTFMLMAIAAYGVSTMRHHSFTPSQRYFVFLKEVG